MIKKLLTRLGIAGGTLAIIIAGAAAFSAFEAHVVNVTASINNALTVPQEASGISFGAIFPEEVAHQPLNVSLSTSFLNESRVDDVSYMIRQKPKCVSDTDPSVHPQVTEQGVTFVCPAGSHQMPLLCPYLSKHLVTGNCNPDLPVGTEGSCTGIDAFHGTASSTLWTETVTEATQVNGHLVKGGNTTDNWDIDLHAPCFKGMCAQDNVIPADFQPDPSLEGQTFGCDLWVEVNGISTTTETGTGTLTVTKVVVGGTKVVSDFPLFVDGASVTSGVTATTTATTHQVSETSDPDYVGTFSGDCGSTGLVTVPPNGSASCTLTNTFDPRPGTLTIVKNTTGGNGTFDFTVTGASSSSPSITTVGGTGTTGSMTVGSGTYTVSETVPDGWALGTATCDDGTSSLTDNTISNIKIAPASNVTCTFNDSKNTGTITVYKVVNNNGLGTSTPADFQMQIDGSSVAQGATTTEATGLHTVSEANAGPYVTSFSGDCNTSGQITLATKQAAVCVVTNTFPIASLKIVKTVNNIHGGTAAISSFTYFVGSTQVQNNTVTNFIPGTYNISEGGVRGYSATFSGACNGVNSVTLHAGDNVECDITNTDIAPVISLNLNITGTGTATTSDFNMFIDGTFVPQNSSQSVTSNASHSITITGNNHTSGYTNSGVTGTSAFGVSCPASLPGNVTLTPGDSISCTITETH
ncbi:MAG: hypothetical protein P4L74_07375 [Candidatus Doudnabacteria bacterium]|nr:hypothetical protein [Candidatus Doudnabacteria bacterium]